MYFNNQAPNHQNHHGDRDYRPQARPHLLPNPPHHRNSDRPSFPPTRGRPNQHYRGRGGAPHRFQQERKHAGPYFPQRNHSNVPVQSQMPAPWAVEPPYLRQSQFGHPERMPEQWDRYAYPILEDPNIPSTSNGPSSREPSDQQYQGYGQQQVDCGRQGGLADHHQPEERERRSLNGVFGPQDYQGNGIQDEQQGSQSHQSLSQQQRPPTPPRDNGAVPAPTAPTPATHHALIKQEADDDEIEVLSHKKVDHKFSVRNRLANETLNHGTIFNTVAEKNRAMASALDMVFKTFASAKCIETSTRRARASSAEPLTAWRTDAHPSTSTAISVSLETQQPCSSSSLDTDPLPVALPDSSVPEAGELNSQPIALNLEGVEEAHGPLQDDETQQVTCPGIVLNEERVREIRAVLAFPPPPHEQEQPKREVDEPEYEEFASEIDRQLAEQRDARYAAAIARPPTPEPPRKPRARRAPKKKTAPKKDAPKKVSKLPAKKRKPAVKKAPLQDSSSNSTSTVRASTEQLFWPSGRPKRSSVKVAGSYKVQMATRVSTRRKKLRF